MVTGCTKKESNVIKIGVFEPITGANAAGGQLEVEGIKLANKDADRFGGEDGTGILNPNHVLCVLFDYLAAHRDFPAAMGVGRTIGTRLTLPPWLKPHQY